MATTQEDFITPMVSEFNLRIADIEEKQRLLRDRMMLVGKNIVELREQASKDITDLKVRLDDIEKNIEKLIAGFLRIGEELEKKARKSELEIIERQLKMFQPLNFIREEDLDKILKGKKKDN
jgi:hypothetical protein